MILIKILMRWIKWLRRPRSQIPPSATQRAPPNALNLDTPLFYWSPVDPATIRDLCTHIHGFGGTGSGKTSALFATLCRVWLAYGNGLLILCPKKETRLLVEQYARECGRSAHLIVISPDHAEHTFNFMEYALRKYGHGGFAVENLVNMFTHIVEIAEGKPEMGGSDQF